ncbi:MAG: hypothetical protein EXX96DRAFT_600264 [Benjaminiella poitrasii]|nr:MAG: hypothetical protein EXX96DRAFT_600264 [Benjaminiella poitrasii]
MAKVAGMNRSTVNSVDRRIHMPSGSLSAIELGNIQKAHLEYDSLLFKIKNKVTKGKPAVDRSVIQKLLKLVHRSKRKDDLRFLEKVLKDMNDSLQLAPTHFEYHLLMYAYGLQKLPEKASEVFQQMRQVAKLEPTIYSYNMLLGCYKRANDVQKAEVLMSEMKQHRIQPDTVTYNTMLHLLLKEQRFDRLFDVFRTMTKENVRMDVYTYSTMLSAVVKAKNPSQQKVGQRICDYLMSDKVKKKDVDVNIVNNMMRFLAKTSLSKVLELYHSLGDKYPHIQPDRVTFNILLDLFLKNGSPGRAYMLYEDMKKMKLDPDVITYGTLIDAEAKEGNLKEAMELFKDMCDASIQPNERILNSLVNIASSKYASQTDLDHLIHLVDQYQHTLHLDTKAYNSLMYGLALNGRSEQVQHIYDSVFRNLDRKPDISTFTNLTLSYINDNLIEDAMSIYKTLREFHKKCKDDQIRSKAKIPIELDATFFSTLISALTKETRHERGVQKFITTYDPEDSLPRLITAMSMFNDMRSLRIQPTEYIYTAMLHACGQYRDQYVLEQVHKLIKVDLYLDPDIGLYNSLMDAYNRTDNGDMVLDIWQTLSLTGSHSSQPLAPDQITVSIVFDSCGHNGLFNRALSIWNWLKRTEFKLSTNNYNSYIECLCRGPGRMGWDIARELVEKEMSTPLRPMHGKPVIDNKTVNTLISFAKKKNFDTSEIEKLEKWKAELHSS